MKKSEGIDLQKIGKSVKLRTGKNLLTAFSQDGSMFGYIVKIDEDPENAQYSGKHLIYVIKGNKDVPRSLLQNLQNAH